MHFDAFFVHFDAFFEHFDAFFVHFDAGIGGVQPECLENVFIRSYYGYILIYFHSSRLTG